VIQKKMKIVGADPGYSDFLHCLCSGPPVHGPRVDGVRQKQTRILSKFRLTRSQLRRESKSKKFDKIRRELKRRKFVFHYAPPLSPTGRFNSVNTSIREIEGGLSGLSSKTVNFHRFLRYMKAKIRTSVMLTGPQAYGNPIYRKFRHCQMVNRKRSIMQAVARFRRVHGRPHKTILCVGDWNRNGRQATIRGLPSIPGGKTLLRHFQIAGEFRVYEAVAPCVLLLNIGCALTQPICFVFENIIGYKVYLINEHNTSIRCHNCQNAGSQPQYKISFT